MGRPRRAREQRYLVFQPVAAHFDASHQHRRVRLFQTTQNFIDTGVERFVIDGRFGFAHDRCAGQGDHVARQFDIDRLRMAQAVGEHARDVGRRARHVVELHLIAGDLLEHLELRIKRLGLMVQQQARARLALAWPAGDDDHRRLLGKGRGHRVDHVQRPGAVGHRRHAQTHIHARRGVGGKADAGLVRERVERQDLRLLDDAEIRQRKVAGNAKDLAGAMILEGVQQGFGEVHGCGHVVGRIAKPEIVARSLRRWCSLRRLIWSYSAQNMHEGRKPCKQSPSIATTSHC